MIDAALPPLRRGILRIYSMEFCPYVHRTKLILEHKDVAYVGYEIKYVIDGYSLAGMKL